MKHKQRGMTLISWILVLLVALVFGIATLRLVPIYLEYLKVTSSLSSVQREYNGQTVSQTELRTALRKRFDIESVRIIKINDVKIERQGGGYRLRAAYEHRAPFIANVSFVVSFDKSVQIASH